MNSESLENPESHEVSEMVDRSTIILQRLFDGTITEEEAAELLGVWNRFPETKFLSHKSYDIEMLFRLHNCTKKPLSPDGLEKLKRALHGKVDITAMPMSSDESMQGTAIPIELWNTAELARLAAESAALPKKPSEKKTPMPVTSAVKPKKPLKPYEPYRIPKLLPALCLIGIITWIVWSWTSPNQPDESRMATRKVPDIAVVTASDEVCWSPETPAPKYGEALVAGPLRFESGTIELLFFNGVRAVVEGPADLLLINEKRVFCDRGSWSATVPPQGSGFTIQTSQCTIRDVGTKFYTMIDDQGSDLHVLQGTVELERSGKGKMTLTTGQEFRVRQQETPRSSPTKFDPVDFDRFVTKTEMRRRSDLFLQSLPVQRNADVQPILGVEFADPSPRGAVVTGGLPVEGPTPELKALRLGDSGDHVRLKAAGKVEAMTFIGWFRFNGLNAQVNPILMSAGSKSNGIVWQVTNQGNFVVGLRQKTRYGAGTFPTPVVVTPDDFGRWIQLALTVDGTKQQITVYVDGNIVFTGKLPQRTELDLNELDLGSWKSESGDKNWVWQLDASVGPASLYDRVLELHEIRSLSH